MLYRGGHSSGKRLAAPTLLVLEIQDRGQEPTDELSVQNLGKTRLAGEGFCPGTS